MLYFVPYVRHREHKAPLSLLCMWLQYPGWEPIWCFPRPPIRLRQTNSAETPTNHGRTLMYFSISKPRHVAVSCSMILWAGTKSRICTREATAKTPANWTLNPWIRDYKNGCQLLPEDVHGGVHSNMFFQCHRTVGGIVVLKCRSMSRWDDVCHSFSKLIHSRYKECRARLKIVRS